MTICMDGMKQIVKNSDVFSYRVGRFDDDYMIFCCLL